MSVSAIRLSRIRVRAASLVLGALLVLVALPFLGRWEEQRNADRQNARMAVIYRLATSDGLISKRLYAYRLGWRVDCLVYSDPANPAATNALELCFDAHGRLVETIDRRASTPRFASLREQASLATIRVPPPRIIAAFAAAGAYRYDPRMAGVSRTASLLPVDFNDIGAYHFPRRVRRPHKH